VKRAAAPPVGPAMINVPSDAAPLGVRAGQTLVVHNQGLVPANFNAGQGSRVDVLGGTVQGNFEAVDAEVNVMGGTILGLDAFLGTRVHMSGGTLSATLIASELETMSGTITSLLASNGSNADIRGGRLTGASAQTSSTISIHSGQVGNLLTARSDSTINIHGGTIGEVTRGGSIAVLIEQGAKAHMTGGVVAVYPFEARLGSEVTISGGVVENGLNLLDADVTISGGQINRLSGRADVVIRGGNVNEIDLAANSDLEIHATSFLLDGAPIAGLTAPGDSLLLPNRNGERLEAFLTDGSILQFDLFATNLIGQVRDSISPLAELRLTLVPVPESTSFAGAVCLFMSALFSRPRPRPANLNSP
jgi:hypothetical protein